MALDAQKTYQCQVVRQLLRFGLVLCRTRSCHIWGLRAQAFFEVRLLTWKDLKDRWSSQLLFTSLMHRVLIWTNEVALVSWGFGWSIKNSFAWSTWFWLVFLVVAIHHRSRDTLVARFIMGLTTSSWSLLDLTTYRFHFHFHFLISCKWVVRGRFYLFPSVFFDTGFRWIFLWHRLSLITLHLWVHNPFLLLPRMMSMF